MPRRDYCLGNAGYPVGDTDLCGPPLRCSEADPSDPTGGQLEIDSAKERSTQPFDLQPVLKGELLELGPLRAQDFDDLFAVASDPLIWEQHPHKDRYKEEEFRGVLPRSLGVWGGLDRHSIAEDGRVIGSSRFHGYDEETSEMRSAGRSWPDPIGAAPTTAT